jgi:hypothetical protein
LLKKKKGITLRQRISGAIFRRSVRFVTHGRFREGYVLLFAE